MRDGFSNKTKEALAKRVAWRCSFPGCNRITIGPNLDNPAEFLNLGEASHIYAASPNGPRRLNEMTQQQRTSIDNGIWMCRQHAKLIDADSNTYSADTIKQWKNLAENETYRLLKDLDKIDTGNLSTLVLLSGNIIFEGIWKAVKDNNWTFEVRRFIKGEINNLRDFNDTITDDEERYIVVETQGDGRKINGNIQWYLKDELYHIEVIVSDKSPKTTPYELADIAYPLEFENGDLKIVKGEDFAKQNISILLGVSLGEIMFSPKVGSFFSEYYWQFKNDLHLLTRLLKLEITRLFSIPHHDSLTKVASPPLDYINRIKDVEILSLEASKNKIPVRLKLEWGDGKVWQDLIYVYIAPDKKML